MLKFRHGRANLTYLKDFEIKDKQPVTRLLPIWVSGSSPRQVPDIKSHNKTEPGTWPTIALIVLVFLKSKF